MVGRRFRFAAMDLLGCAIALALAGCGPQTAGEQLQDYFLEESPPVLSSEALGELNLAFAQQLVRAHGYQVSGVEAPLADGWAPALERSAEEDFVLDPHAWQQSGVIDDLSGFNPSEPSNDFPAPEPHRVEGLSRVEERQALLVGALEQFQQPLIDLEWSTTIGRAFVVDRESQSIQVHPRLLWLVPVVAGEIESLDPQPSVVPGTAPSPAEVDPEPPEDPSRTPAPGPPDLYQRSIDGLWGTCCDTCCGAENNPDCNWGSTIRGPPSGLALGMVIVLLLGALLGRDPTGRP